MMQENDISKDNVLIKKRWLRVLFALLVCVAACGVYYRFVVVNTYVELDIEVAGRTDFRIFWAGDNDNYSVKRMGRVRVYPGKTHYSFYLTDIRKVEKLRIDPFAYTGKALIKKITLKQEGCENITLSTAEEFKRLTPLNQIGDYQMVEGGLEVNSKGSDPYFEMNVAAKETGFDRNWLGIRMLFVVALTFLVIYCSGSLVSQFRFVPLLLFGAWLLVIIMAGISKRNVHPDEYVHLYAVSYYQDHWLPPVVDDPEIGKTYSVYGISRLNNGGMFYLLAGKYETMMQAFRISDLFSKRLLNVSLFGLIFFYTMRNRYARLVAIPLLLSPQIWYVFSYCTSDALAVTLAFFAGCQLVDSDSLLQRYLRGAGWGVSIISILTISVLLGMLFLLKKNYYSFIAFFYFCVCLKIFFTEEYYWERRQVLLRLSFITLLGLAVFGVRIGADYYVNGMDRQQKIVDLQEDRAHYKYKPSTPLDEKNLSIQRKNRGSTLKDMFYSYRWGEQSFQSSFGVFGYFTIIASNTYYNLVRYSGILLFAFVFGSILLRGGWLGSTVAVAATGLSVALIGASVYVSWTVDFQAQGRYLFPIAAMFGVVYGLYHEHVNPQILTLGVVCMYILACYNFIFNGLVMIPKIPF